MTKLLANYVTDQWLVGSAEGFTLKDPITGESLVRVDSTGLDLNAVFEYARNIGCAELRKLNYQSRALLLKSTVKVLNENKDKYYEISLKNSGTVKNDSAVDIEGGIFTLGYYAKLGESLSDKNYLLDSDFVSLAKDQSFGSQHIYAPLPGIALLINAFNFPAWGFLEKMGPAILSGVPIILKPASSTAWLAHEMVQDIIQAGIFPPGAITLICGSSKGLLDALKPFDVVSFTGSAQTAKLIRSHPAITEFSVRVNIEADSLNSAWLMEDVQSTDPVFELFIKEVCREMTVKSGQKCTAIRRIFVPEKLFSHVAQAITARLSKTLVGNPRNDSVRMGSIVNLEQKNTVLKGIKELSNQVEIIFDGNSVDFVDASKDSACVAPVLFGISTAKEAGEATSVHELEVFGPVATLVAYKDTSQAIELIAKGQGSLVVSLYGEQHESLIKGGLAIAALHGRVHIVTSETLAQTGHGNVMPQTIHGGPGRSGGGEELGGIRALHFYHRKVGVQAHPNLLNRL
ncbi:3,4-dehydroadipyl-CoA semialdehyde dehydrogenase [Polynucleobacter kasalickyi]|uniref:3,4-dehydroadipyl-CoA semialdehyde dehydrogenase n=1 Tax=Polynucleobacter kasalickyi TaxID=1938817 RepID=A0A1W1ZGB8_9BURK|nr:3,4-dehydroadipyl-CoA semialdehyde dehydrogenase [Polynucleobacter kasalickyi]SMC47550.1 3,4-dehydroadipyl-CoA semialdehyde dehydrogenase [Polynucleobacter kasalickyi]